MKHLLSAVVLGLLAIPPAHGQEAPRPYAASRDYSKWEKEVAAYEEADRQAPPPKEGILFIGSSTIRPGRRSPRTSRITMSSTVDSVAPRSSTPRISPTA